jgi:hypothetical protein
MTIKQEVVEEACKIISNSLKRKVIDKEAIREQIKIIRKWNNDSK